MQTQNVNWVSLVVSILGAVNLIATSYGIHLFNDQQMNAISTLISAAVTVVGVFLTHSKVPAVQTPVQPNPAPQKQTIPPTTP